MTRMGDPRMARLGQLQALVYVECPCGRWCAISEGGFYPSCDACGGFYVPGGGPRHDERGPQFGSTLAESRRSRALGFVAFLTSESGAMRLVNRLRTLVGLSLPESIGPIDLQRLADAGRLYTEAEVRGLSDEVAQDKDNGGGRLG